MSSGDGNGAAENSLVCIVKRLFRWVGPGDSSAANSSSSSSLTESSWRTTQLINSDLNGNLSGRRGQGNDDDRVGNDSSSMPSKDPFRTSRFRFTLGEVGVCRMCGVVGSSEFQTTIETTTRQPIIVCVRCKKLAIARRNRDRPLKGNRDADEDGGKYSPNDGHPVCCCDSCSAVAIRLRLQPPEYSYQSYDETYTSSELLVPSTSLPTSLEAYTSTIQRLPRTSSSDTDDETTRRHPIPRNRTNPGVLGQHCTVQPPAFLRPRPSSGLDVDLPPSIPLSADGEEGFITYRRNLIARNRAAQNDADSGQAPPNVTIRHLTSDDGVV